MPSLVEVLTSLGIHYTMPGTMLEVLKSLGIHYTMPGTMLEVLKSPEVVRVYLTSLWSEPSKVADHGIAHAHLTYSIWSRCKIMTFTTMMPCNMCMMCSLTSSVSVTACINIPCTINTVLGKKAASPYL